MLKLLQSKLKRVLIACIATSSCVLIFYTPFENAVRHIGRRNQTHNEGSYYAIQNPAIQGENAKLLSKMPPDAMIHDNSEPTSCRAKKHFGFLKTHKCGSSTVQNILFRFALEHNINFVLPSYANLLSYCSPFSPVTFPKINVTSKDALAHHIVWNAKGVKETLPKDSVYFTILRDPVDVFESMFVYYELGSHSRFRIPWRNLVEGETNSRLFMRFGVECYGMNQMAYDFGLRVTENQNQSFLLEKIKEFDNDFDLVMIAEEFEKSLVLLRDLLCWDLRDMTYLSANSRLDRFRTNVTEQQRNNLKKLLQADQTLYDYFYKKFQQKVKEYGKERMEKEVEQLRKYNLEIKHKCKFKKENNIEGMFHKEIVQGYRVTGEEVCVNHGRTEMDFTKLLVDKANISKPV